jgi:hypothetical protein
MPNLRSRWKSLQPLSVAATGHHQQSTGLGMRFRRAPDYESRDTTIYNGSFGTWRSIVPGNSKRKPQSST